MKTFRSSAFRWIMLLLLLAGNFRADSVRAAETNAVPPTKVAPFALNDQYGRPHVIAFPQTNLTVLTVADQKGSEQINGWIQPLKERFAKQIDITGIADVGAVPFGLHSLVQSRFRKRIHYPVMLDWSGQVAKGFHYTAGQASVLVLDRDGTVLLRFSGAAGEKELNQMFQTIDQTLQKAAAVDTKSHSVGSVK